MNGGPQRAFDLYLFTTNVHLAREVVGAGVRGLVVDWERRGKAERQHGYDTAIGTDTPEDLLKLRQAVKAPVLCRINPFGDWTAEEVEVAIEAGATEILLPMVRTLSEVLEVLELIGGRCPLGILIETREAVASVDQLCRLPISRAYVGLNDLAIDRGIRNIFWPLIDGTLAALRQSISVPFGFGGLTLPELGHPVPTRLLMAEMARLHCQFTFLRRSFLRDVAGKSLSAEVPRILHALDMTFARPAHQIEQDRQELCRAVAAATVYFQYRGGKG